MTGRHWSQQFVLLSNIVIIWSGQSPLLNELKKLSLALGLKVKPESSLSVLI